MSAIIAGTKLGHYEVLEPLGAGTMGEVYRAHDTKLNRDVALKVLPNDFAKDADRMARFTREAQMLAALNHTNIAAIYGIEESGVKRALILELVEGETIADMIAHGPIPLHETLKIALQISEALEAAHEKGIVHRDLKPANIKVTHNGLVKILDFGLARALGTENVFNPADAATALSDATNPGMIIGTAGYMSPEQARGKPSDRRADIWAFGVVVYEMLTGQRAFQGETASDSIAKVLEREPDWQLLPVRTPAMLRKLLRDCLKKNVRERLQAIGDARTTLQELLADPGALAVIGEGSAYPAWKKWLPWAIAPLLFLLAWFGKPGPAVPDTTPDRFEVTLPAGMNMAHYYRQGVDISPDGRRLAFVAKMGTSTAPEEQAKSQIYIRSIDQWDAVPIPGTEGGINPFFSPDGQWLGFVSRTPSKTQLMKVSLSGGSPVQLADVAAMYGVTWGKDGTIVFADQGNGPLKSIPDGGGTPKPDDFTKVNSEPPANENSHRLPHFLPDGSGVLYTVLLYKNVTPDWSKAQIWVKSTKTNQSKMLIDGGTDARYVSNGALVFARLGKLFAVGFDLKTLTTKGSPVQVLDGVTHATYEYSAPLTTGVAQFSVSDDGTLFYAPGNIEPPVPYSLKWIDRHGTETAVGTRPMSHLSVRVSPDGTQILFNQYYLNADLWIYDTVRGIQTRENLDGQNAAPLWTPDGNSITFRSDRSGPTAIYEKKLNSDDLVQLTSGPRDTPNAWSPDGKELAFIRPNGQNGQGVNNIYILEMDKDKPGKIRPLHVSKFAETHAEFSPNGQWIAYDSTESGSLQVYVEPYPVAEDRVQISTDGGSDPAWARDGKELFYINNGKMMSVKLKIAGNKLTPESPVVLFAGVEARNPSRGYDVAPDGRFLMPKADTAQAEERLRKIFPSTLRIVLNWTDELQRLLK